jgi:hypothetical protein
MFEVHSSMRNAVAAVAGLGILAGCVTGRVDQTRGYAVGEDLPKPPIVLVQDFRFHPGKVSKDTITPDIVSERGKTSERLELGRVAADALATDLVQRIVKLGLPARRAAEGDETPMHALVVKGQFLTVDEGDRLKRTVVGFGAGTSEIRTRFQVYQQTETGLRILGRGETTAEGLKKPGMAGPAAVAGATGAVVGVAVAGVLHGASEIKGGVEADAKRTAGAISEKLADVFVQKDWI